MRFSVAARRRRPRPPPWADGMDGDPVEVVAGRGERDRAVAGVADGVAAAVGEEEEVAAVRALAQPLFDQLLGDPHLFGAEEAGGGDDLAHSGRVAGSRRGAQAQPRRRSPRRMTLERAAHAAPGARRRGSRRHLGAGGARRHRAGARRAAQGVGDDPGDAVSVAQAGPAEGGGEAGVGRQAGVAVGLQDPRPAAGVDPEIDAGVAGEPEAPASRRRPGAPARRAAPRRPPGSRRCARCGRTRRSRGPTWRRSRRSAACRPGSRRTRSRPAAAPAGRRRRRRHPRQEGRWRCR